MVAKKKVLENSFFYIFSSLLVQAMGFFLLPVYTMFLTPDDYGVANLVAGFISVTNVIIAFSLHYSIVRFYADFKEDQEKIKKLYGTIISFICISGSIFFILGFIFKDIIIEIFFEGITFYPIVLIALLSVIFVSTHTIHQSILQGMQKGKKLTKVNLIIFFTVTTLKIVFIVVFKLGIVGFLLAQLIINIAYFVYMIIDLKKNDLFKWTIDGSILKETLKYSIPLMPHNLSTKIASLASRVFINASGTLANVGLYSIGMQFGNLIDVVQVAVNKAFQPWFYEIMKKGDEESKKEIINLSNVLLIFYSLIYMCIGLFSQEAVKLMTNDNYIMAWTVIPILVVGFSIKSIYYFYVNIVMFYKEAARKLFIATIIGSLMDIVLAYILVPRFGMYGSAVAFVLAKVIIVSIIVHLSKLYSDIGYRLIKMLSIITPSLLFMIIGLYFSYTKYLTVFSLVNLAYKIIIFLIYLLFIYLANKKAIDKVYRSGNIQKYLFKTKK
ncbi:O-antigen/teichoic acid export membrane protein [Sedimentibacter acidaminivorans]|uniref:O-antigen/teichoic acid export membrane protein n=1 Tax=Sedimentibacter acidaminivorans TaxID=913099 RepID=A0ABS4G9A3_9FIRM|nr:oligosaccharide flippase family protein [Sedimentibacter acidaminivorans]MBP1924258.1 O-antigen/teichoic acid export membrane protein [Sedimentibacter acidaminivorans]